MPANLEVGDSKGRFVRRVECRFDPVFALGGKEPRDLELRAFEALTGNLRFDQAADVPREDRFRLTSKREILFERDLHHGDLLRAWRVYRC